MKKTSDYRCRKCGVDLNVSTIKSEKCRECPYCGESLPFHLIASVQPKPVRVGTLVILSIFVIASHFLWGFFTPAQHQGKSEPTCQWCDKPKAGEVQYIHIKDKSVTTSFPACRYHLTNPPKHILEGGGFSGYTTLEESLSQDMPFVVGIIGIILWAAYVFGIVFCYNDTITMGGSLIPAVGISIGYIISGTAFSFLMARWSNGGTLEGYLAMMFPAVAAGILVILRLILLPFTRKGRA